MRRRHSDDPRQRNWPSTLHAPPEVCCREFLPWLFTEKFFETSGAVDAALARMLNNPHPPTLQGLAGQSTAIGLFDASARVGSIHCPTLVLAGADDILTPPAQSQDLARRIPGAELVVLDPGAHDRINETPRALFDAMLAFLSGAARRERGGGPLSSTAGPAGSFRN